MAIGTVLSEGLNLHATPNGKIIDQLKHGDKLEIIGERAGIQVKRWLRVTWKNQDGWVAEYDHTGMRLVVIEPELGPKPEPKPAPHVGMPRPPIERKPPEPPIPPEPRPMPKPDSMFWLLLAAIIAVIAVVLFVR